MDQKDVLIGRMEDLAAKAAKTGFAASRFLTPAEAERVAAYFTRRREVALSFDGGYENAERVRAVFLNPEWGTCERTELFSVLKIEYRPQDTLGHRDILGAIMALGIERDTVGDIDAETPPVTLICLPEICGYISDNLTKAGRIGVNISTIALDGLTKKTENMEIKTDTVASLRLDAVLSAAFGLSRGKAAGIIAAGLVSLNHVPCLQSAKEVFEGDIISVRGSGRAKLTEISGTSKKGRIFVRIGLYRR